MWVLYGSLLYSTYVCTYTHRTITNIHTYCSADCTAHYCVQPHINEYTCAYACMYDVYSNTVMSDIMILVLDYVSYKPGETWDSPSYSCCPLKLFDSPEKTKLPSPGYSPLYGNSPPPPPTKCVPTTGNPLEISYLVCSLWSCLPWLKPFIFSVLV